LREFNAPIIRPSGPSGPQGRQVPVTGDHTVSGGVACEEARTEKIKKSARGLFTNSAYRQL